MSGGASDAGGRGPDGEPARPKPARSIDSYLGTLGSQGPLYALAHGELSEEDAAELRALKSQIQQRIGFRCDGYKERCLRRRIAVRMRARGVHAFAAPLDVDPATLVSGTFAIEWPRRSGRTVAFPEIDRAAWFDPHAARAWILEAQAPLVERCLVSLREAPRS